MTDDEVAANPFKTKESKIDVTFANGTTTETKAITINQTNKALLVNGSGNPSQIIVHAIDAPNQSIAITSNAKWKMNMTVSTAVNNLNPLTGTVSGTEKNDNTSETTTQKYDMLVDVNNTRYTTLTFADNESQKRFNDVNITITQCSGTTDPTMLEWKQALVAANGGALEKDTPAANGVAWHQDHEENIFFSMNYDPTNPTGSSNRWMTTNLSTKNYGQRTGGEAWTAPSLTNDLVYSSTAGYWVYPGPNLDGTNGSISTTYNQRPRLGLLYNYAAAIGGQNLSIGDQSVQEPDHAAVQGICPIGWHLPTYKEWSVLYAIIRNNASKYSGLGAGHYDVGFAMMDMCEANVHQNKSNTILNGGFAGLHVGDVAQGSFGQVAYFWSSTSEDSTGAKFFYIGKGSGDLFHEGGGRPNLFSVRCKKDN